MDDLERRLRRDAAGIEATVPPELAARIRSRLTAAVRPRSRRAASPLRLWAAASLSGAAAALAVILLTPGLRPTREPPRVVQPAPVPEDVARAFPLVVQTAELTAPLEEELDDLRSDLEKARERVEDDLDF